MNLAATDRAACDASAPDRYAVVGHPVAHSLSPRIHAEFARLTGERIDYGRLDCPRERFAAAIAGFAAGGARGCNVTVPFKFEALGHGSVRVASERAQLAGAANTLRFDAGGWFADNTDGVGLVTDLEVHAGRRIAGCRLLLVGAGGAAAGVLGPLLDARPAEVVVANRTADKAVRLVARHAARAHERCAALRAAPLNGAGGGFDLVVNASASSLHGSVSPVPRSVFGAGALAVDLMYGPAAAPFLAWARAAGAAARDGLGMLVEQAAESFWLWRGVRPPTAPVLAQLRAELAGAG